MGASPTRPTRATSLQSPDGCYGNGRSLLVVLERSWINHPRHIIDATNSLTSLEGCRMKVIVNIGC